jgi:hypothetical protein
MHVKYKQDKLHRKTWYIGTCRITAMGLLYMLTLWSNVCYMGLGSNGCFVTNVVLMGGHYRTDIISGVGNPRSNSVVPLVLWI